MIYQTNSALETQKLAGKLAKNYLDGAILALTGPLGAGKTTFTQGFAQGLGVKEHLISPTFILIRQYNIPGKDDGKLFHIDLYRLSPDQLNGIGLEEIFTNPKNIVLIEWAEKLGKMKLQKLIQIKIQSLSSDKRQIEVQD